MITLLIYSGMRRGELLGLKWDDIDFKTNRIQIVRSILYTSEKGIYEETPKNEKSKRSISIPDPVIKLLKEYKVDQNKKEWRPGSNGTITIMYSQHGTETNSIRAQFLLSLKSLSRKTN